MKLQLKPEKWLVIFLSKNSWTGFILVLLIVLHCSGAARSSYCDEAMEEAVTIKASYDRKEIRVGEPFNLVITVTQSGAARGLVVSPVIRPSMEGFRVIGTTQQQNIQMINNSMTMTSRHIYTLVAEREGRLTIGPASITYTKDGSKTITASTETLEINVEPAAVSSGSSASETRTEKSSRESVIGFFRYAAILLILTLALIAFYISPRQNEREKLPVAENADTILKTDSLKQAALENNHNRFTDEFMRLLKLFANQRYSIETSDLTGQELLELLEKKSELSELIQDLKRLLELVETARFAGGKLDSSDMNRAIEIISRLKQLSS